MVRSEDLNGGTNGRAITDGDRINVKDDAIEIQEHARTKRDVAAEITEERRANKDVVSNRSKLLSQQGISLFFAHAVSIEAIEPLSRWPGGFPVACQIVILVQQVRLTEWTDPSSASGRAGVGAELRSKVSPVCQPGALTAGSTTETGIEASLVPLGNRIG